MAVTEPRLVLWRGLDEWRTEVAELQLTADGVRAQGTQIGTDPLAYRLDYRLDASERFITRSLEVEAIGEGWRRTLFLSHDGEGAWRCEVEESGDPDLPAPGGETKGLTEALDCDLGLSPLTNLMPIRRDGLHEGPGSTDLVMAWVSVPDLELFASEQRYEHVSRDPDGSVVRFLDRGRFAGFTAELELDRDGIVRVYPSLAERVIGS